MGIDDEEESLLEDIFGPNGKLPYEAFIEVVSRSKKGANWVFSAPELRRKIFREAQIPMRHISKSVYAANAGPTSK